MKVIATLSILFATAFTVAMGMTCPATTSPGTDYCSTSCGCYCGGDNRVHCDETSQCFQSSGSAKQSCIDNCTCP